MKDFEDFSSGSMATVIGICASQFEAIRVHGLNYRLFHLVALFEIPSPMLPSKKPAKCCSMLVNSH